MVGNGTDIMTARWCFGLARTWRMSIPITGSVSRLSSGVIRLCLERHLSLTGKRNLVSGEARSASLGLKE